MGNQSSGRNNNDNNKSGNRNGSWTESSASHTTATATATAAWLAELCLLAVVAGLACPALLAVLPARDLLCLGG